MTTRGIRGATTIDSDSKDNVLSAVHELLGAILAANPDLKPVDIASALFTTTEDISSAFPAFAARQMGWTQVPMISAREIPVPKSLPLCIRVLILWNTDIKQNSIQHIYLRDAANLRPDFGPHT
ncbi:MAG: chorismate mutase [Deltaproteobacteria bacterium]|nr:chorismate mutase [Deltaproteobacteria bacterium]